MTGAQAATILAMEILEEMKTVTPVRIALKLLRSSVKRPPALIVPEKESSQSALQL